MKIEIKGSKNMNKNIKTLQNSSSTLLIALVAIAGFSAVALAMIVLLIKEIV